MTLFSDAKNLYSLGLYPVVNGFLSTLNNEQFGDSEEDIILKVLCRFHVQLQTLNSV